MTLLVEFLENGVGRKRRSRFGAGFGVERIDVEKIGPFPVAAKEIGVTFGQGIDAFGIALCTTWRIGAIDKLGDRCFLFGIILVVRKGIAIWVGNDFERRKWFWTFDPLKAFFQHTLCGQRGTFDYRGVFDGIHKGRCGQYVVYGIEGTT